MSAWRAQFAITRRWARRSLPDALGHQHGRGHVHRVPPNFSSTPASGSRSPASASVNSWGHVLLVALLEILLGAVALHELVDAVEQQLLLIGQAENPSRRSLSFRFSLALLLKYRYASAARSCAPCLRPSDGRGGPAFRHDDPPLDDGYLLPGGMRNVPRDGT